MAYSLSLNGKSALVTGSTRGIGAGIADGLEANGAHVLRHGRTSDDPDILLVDMAKPGGAKELIDQAFAKDPNLSILISNAGSFFDKPFLEITEEAFDNTINLNVKSMYFVCREFSKRLVAEKREGSIVIVGSTNGFLAEEDSTAYDTSKGALVMMTKSLALTLGKHGIRVNSLAPGLIRTPLTGWMDSKPEKVAHYCRKAALGRIGTPEDCAGLCVFLSSDAASYITGQSIIVDGGLTLSQISPMV